LTLKQLPTAASTSRARGYSQGMVLATPEFLRNTGDDGNVGIIRSPVRAIVLPDRPAVSDLRHSPGKCAK
jgi:hypothetical protein